MARPPAPGPSLAAGQCRAWARRSRLARMARRLPDGFGDQPPARLPRKAPTNSGGPIKVVASKANNSLLIRATPEDYDRIEATLARLDTAPWQVLIEATIAEVTLNDTLRYGVQYFLEERQLRRRLHDLGDASLNALRRHPVKPGFNFLFTPGSSTIAIDALSRVTDVKVLSAPVGGRAGQQRGGADRRRGGAGSDAAAAELSRPNSNILNSIEYRDTGVILQVRPRINSNQAVSLEIAQEVSRVNRQSEQHGRTRSRRPSRSARSPAGSTSRAARPWCSAA